MKKTNQLSLKITFIAILLITLTCKKDELVKVTKLEIGTEIVVTETTASVAATFVDVSANVTAFGFCYAISSNPEVSDSKTTNSGTAKKGPYSSNLTGLTPNTKYYVRAYALEGANLVYSSGEISFTTLASITITSPVSSDHWVVGETEKITWTNNISEGVTLLLLKDGVLNLEIYASTYSDGDYNWTLPTNLTYSNNYTIKIESTSNSNLNSESEPFTISEVSGSTGTLTDFNNNSYNTIKIGYQWWMAENLKVTHYSNGTEIPLVTDNTIWESLGDNNTDKAYCYYDNNIVNFNIYGALYTWAAAMNGVSGSVANPSGIQGVCPTDWHLPSDAEWKELEMYLGMSQVEADAIDWRGTDEGSKLAGNEAFWVDGILKENVNFGTSGFLALPAGTRSTYGTFHNVGVYGYWWNATEGDGTQAWRHCLSSDYIGVKRNNQTKSRAYSIRCVRD